MSARFDIWCLLGLCCNSGLFFFIAIFSVCFALFLLLLASLLFLAETGYSEYVCLNAFEAIKGMGFVSVKPFVQVLGFFWCFSWLNVRWVSVILNFFFTGLIRSGASGFGDGVLKWNLYFFWFCLGGGRERQRRKERVIKKKKKFIVWIVNMLFIF